MKATLAQKSLEWFREGENLRPIEITDGIKELCYSIVASSLLQPVSAIDHGDYGEPIIGFRRLAALHWGVTQNLAVPDVIPVMLYPPDTPRDLVKILQLTENLQRLDISDLQLYLSVVELEKLGLPRKTIAEKLGVSAGSVTRYFAPDNCPPEAREHFFAERLTLGQCYKISTAEGNALEVMGVFLNGGTREKASKATKPKNATPAEKTTKVRIPLAITGDGYDASGVVTVASLPGEEIDWEGVKSLLKQAANSVKEAQKENWTFKTAMSTWRDSTSAT